MTKIKLNPQNYSGLVSQLRLELTQGLQAAQEALDQQRAKTYWAVGQQINAFLKTNTVNSKKDFYEALSVDLGLASDLLKRTTRFNRLYPQPPASGLLWTHYLALIRIKNEKQRLQLQTRILAQDISTLEIKALVTEFNAKPTAPGTQGKILKVTRGTPFIYRVSPLKQMKEDDDVLGLDLGFKIMIEKPDECETVLVRGKIMRSLKLEGQYQLQQTTFGAEALYTYTAVIDYIVDGDTFVAYVDVGFGVRIHEKFRLRGIDAPEISTAKGLAAKKFVESRLKPNDKIIIRTYKDDKYGRYLADLFYAAQPTSFDDIAANGTFLNQQLLDEGLAEIYL